MRLLRAGLYCLVGVGSITFAGSVANYIRKYDSYTVNFTLPKEIIIGVSGLAATAVGSFCLITEAESRRRRRSSNHNLEDIGDQKEENHNNL